MNSKHTKRALFSSFWALLLCFAMLLGTTFAWFTDTASTSVNKIQAGNLDVMLEVATDYELYIKDDGSVGFHNIGGWQSAEGQTLSFITNGASDILWEPGCTYALPPLRVTNNGNLALKFQVAITGINGDAKLNEAIEWDIPTTFVVGGTYATLQPGNSTAFKIAGHMKEEAGNEYQGLSIDSIAITVYATQTASEYDSFDNQYDAGAEFLIPFDGEAEELPEAVDNVYTITTAGQLYTYLNGNKVPADSIVKLACDVDFGGATIKGYADQGTLDSHFDGQGHTISNFKIVGRDNYDLYASLFSNVQGGSVKNLTVKNATVIGNKQVGVIAGGVNGGTIDNCHVYDCTIIGQKKVGAVAGYSNGAVNNCSATNCTVICTGETEDGTTTYQCGEVVGYNDTAATASGNTNSNVTIIKGNAALVSSAADLTAAVAENTTNVNVILTDDFTAPADWTPIDIGFYGDYTNVTNLTINGNGHTITGLASALVEKVSGNCSVTINDLTVKDAEISNSSYTNSMGNGILVGYIENGNVTLNNCKVVDSEIAETSVAAAALIGYASGTDQIKLTNCEVKNTDVTGNSAAGFIGYVQQENVTVSGCKVSGGSFTGENTQKQGAYFGTVNSGATVNISDTTADTTALVGRILSTGAVNYN